MTMTHSHNETLLLVLTSMLGLVVYCLLTLVLKLGAVHEIPDQPNNCRWKPEISGKFQTGNGWIG